MAFDPTTLTASDIDSLDEYQLRVALSLMVHGERVDQEDSNEEPTQ